MPRALPHTVTDHSPRLERALRPDFDDQIHLAVDIAAVEVVRDEHADAANADVPSDQDLEEAVPHVVDPHGLRAGRAGGGVPAWLGHPRTLQPFPGATRETFPPF